jgi:hypothetical protein
VRQDKSDAREARYYTLGGPSKLTAMAKLTVECLQMCLQLVKKKLKSGTPTGDILDDVNAGKDEPINEKARLCWIPAASGVVEKIKPKSVSEMRQSSAPSLAK